METNTVTSYSGTYAFTSGKRKMSYCLLEDLPEQFFPPRQVKSASEGKKPRKTKLVEGQKLVWDLENKGIRIVTPTLLDGALETKQLSFQELQLLAPEGNRIKELLNNSQQSS